jgi:hypothetical protein
MRRLKDYCKFIAWQTGIGYLVLWAVTFWTLDEGATVFGKSGACFPDQAKVLFYWVCDASSPLTILAGVANAALTATVWAPVYIAAATAQPDAAIIAGPIIALHVIGLPLGIFVLVRLLAAALGLWRLGGAGRAGDLRLARVMPAVAAPDAPAAPVRPAMPPRVQVKPRSDFGLRGRDDS